MRYRDLCLVATGPEDERAAGYYEQFDNGSAQWFHMKLVATERDAIDEHVIMNEVSYCAVASAALGKGERKVSWVWPVLSVELKTRRELTLAQTGKTAGRSNERYWLFELDRPIALAQPIEGFDSGHHHMKLTRRADLGDIEHFKDVIVRYPGIG